MIVLEANYSKKLGLPGFSSHQYSLTIRKEVGDITQVEAESRQLYRTLQANVDRDIQQVGFLPEPQNGNGHKNGSSGHASGNGTAKDFWACSPKQRDLILKIVDENHLDKNEVEDLAKERFNAPVKTLNTLQASGFISELLERYPSKDQKNGNRRFERRSAGKVAQ